MGSNLGEKCRLCFSTGFFHINLFTTSQRVIESIREIFRSEVDEFDALPNFVCVDCWLKMKTFYEFYQKVIAAQRQFLSDGIVPIKIESDHEEPVFNETNYDDLSIPETPNEIEMKYDEIEQNTESVVFHEELRTDRFGSDNGDDDEEDGDSDADFQEDHSDSDESFKDDSETIEDADEADEYTPTKAYKRKDLDTEQPKRKRGRPRKYRTQEERKEANRRKALNWRAGKIYKCPHCVKTFTRRTRISVHIRLRHGFECAACNLKLPSEQKLKQHSKIHETDFDAKLRQKLNEISSIDTNDVESDEKEKIWQQFDRKCDECPTEFNALNEAQVHYLNEHNNNRGYIKCCDMKLREEHMVKEHIAYHKNPEIYYCFVCDLSIKVKSYLRNHLKNHIVDLLESPKYVCDICNKHFATKANVMYHKAETHTTEKIKCEICAKTLFNEAQKEKHMRNIHETMSQQQLDYVINHFDMSCDQCEVMFESFSHAKRHYLSEHSEPKGYIKCCNKKMKTLAAIDSHIQWHHHPESLRCPICDKLFNLKDHFKCHVRRHNKVFTCEVCGKSFKRHTTLVGHRKAVHESGPRDFQCNFCGLRFLTEEKRDGHEQLIHYGNTTGARIVCDVCGRGFSQTSHLQKHIQAHHSDDPQKRAKKDENKSEMCTICGLWLSSRYRLKLHRKCHPTELNRCQECGLEAPNHDALLGHIRAFHEIRRKHKCRLCDKSFNNADELQEHSTCHATEKLYRCVYCLEAFVWRRSLDAHMKKLHPLECEGEKATESKIEDQST